EVALLRRAAGAAARQRRQLIPSLIGTAVRSLICADEDAVGREEIGEGVSVVVAAVQRPCVLPNELLNLDLIAGGERPQRRAGRFLLGRKHCERQQDGDG